MIRIRQPDGRSVAEFVEIESAKRAQRLSSTLR
jgi:hypothetical protein